jgi:hypothetical protein
MTLIGSLKVGSGIRESKSKQMPLFKLKNMLLLKWNSLDELNNRLPEAKEQKWIGNQMKVNHP